MNDLAKEMCAEDAHIIEHHTYNFSETIENSLMKLESGHILLTEKFNYQNNSIESMAEHISGLEDRIEELERRCDQLID